MLALMNRVRWAAGNGEKGIVFTARYVKRFHDMEQALKNQPDIPFRIPKGIKLVRINNKTGKPATPNDTSVIFEALKPDFDFNKNKQRIIGEEAKPAHSLEDTAKVFGVDEDNDFQLGTEY